MEYDAGFAEQDVRAVLEFLEHGVMLRNPVGGEHRPSGSSIRPAGSIPICSPICSPQHLCIVPLLLHPRPTLCSRGLAARLQRYA